MTDSPFGPVIHAYSRADALADGVLIDAGPPAREAGFKVPVALTVAAWARCVTVPPGKEGLQDESGRLWDVLHMARVAAMRAPGQDRVPFSVSVVTREGRRRVSLYAHIGPGDTGEPVVTVLLEGED